MNVDWGRAIPFPGIHKWDFCCSAGPCHFVLLLPLVLSSCASYCTFILSVLSTSVSSCPFIICFILPFHRLFLVFSSSVSPCPFSSVLQALNFQHLVSLASSFSVSPCSFNLGLLLSFHPLLSLFFNLCFYCPFLLWFSLSFHPLLLPPTVPFRPSSLVPSGIIARRKMFEHKSRDPSQTHRTGVAENCMKIRTSSTLFCCTFWKLLRNILYHHPAIYSPI